LIKPSTSVDTSDLSVRVEKLERSFAGYDEQLGILVRAILSAGVLQGRGGPSVHDVADGDVDRLARALAEGEAAR
jgi:hypothetical protein